MADVNANIGVNIDTSAALAELKNLQRQISNFHNSIAKSSASASIAQRNLQQGFVDSINSSGQFAARIQTIRTSAESFTNSLEKNKFSMREYFRYGVASSKMFGKTFRTEFATIEKVAVERVRRLQTQYIKMGRDANGAMKAIAVTPLALNMDDLATKTMIAAQKQQLFNQLLQQGSTNLINFGKNTQWAGRQLMVGFTLPLTVFGSTASKVFMELELEMIRFKRVYGDLFTLESETQANMQNIRGLASEFTKYGVTVRDTLATAADAAAAGFSGKDLEATVRQSTRLAVLGEVDRQEAFKATIALQTAFKLNNNELAESVNFLNAVENQSVVSLQNLTDAIPRVAPIIRGLGGDVRDMSVFLAAMQEGGVDAAQAANGLKSALASIINPTRQSRDMLEGVGINIDAIVEGNAGNLMRTMLELGDSLKTLAPLARQRILEQLFGKFQFARVAALFDNLARSGSQAQRTMELMQMSSQDLAQLANKELAAIEENTATQFKMAVEDIRAALAPVGELFLQIVTPVIKAITGIIERFNDLSDNSKRVVGIIISILGGVAPILLMLTGLAANFAGNFIKFFALIRNGYLKLSGQSKYLGDQTQYLTSEQMEAEAVAASLDQVHARLTQRFTSEATALNVLRQAYVQATEAARRFAINNSGMMIPQGPTRKYNKGVSIVPGSGNQDTVAAMLTPGESVIPADMTQKYGSLINGMIADNIPGFNRGVTGVGTGQTVGTVLGGTFKQRSFSSLAMMAPGNYSGGFGMDPEWLALNEEAKASFASALRTAGMAEANIRQTKNNYQDFWSGLNPVLDGIFDIFAQGITPDVKNVADVGDSQYPLMVSHINELESNLQISADTAEQIRNALRKLVAPLESDLTQKDVRRAEIAIDEAGEAYVKRASYERFGETLKPQVSRNFPRELEMRGMLPPTHSEYSFAHIPQATSQEVTLPTYLRKKSGSGNLAEIALMEQINSGVDIKEGHKIGVNLGKEYKAGVKASGAKDIYEETRERQSPHRLAPQDGKDDARAYSTARDQELDKRLRTSTSNYVQTESGLMVPGGSSGFAAPRSPEFLGMPAMPPRATFGSKIRGKYSQVSEKMADRRASMQPMMNKFNGAAMALTSVGIAASMIPGPFGDIAQKAMPVIMGIQGLAMALPMLMTPMGAAVGIVAAVATGFYLVNKAQKDYVKSIKENAEKEAKIRQGSADSIESYSEFLGEGGTPSQRQFNRVGDTRFISAENAKLAKFREYYEGVGKDSAEVIRFAATKGSAEALAATARDVADRITVFGLDPADIAANIKAAAELAGINEIDLKAKIQELVAPGGKDILKSPLDINSRIKFLSSDIKSVTDSLSKQISKVTGAKAPTLGAKMVNSFLAAYGGAADNTQKQKDAFAADQTRQALISNQINLAITKQRESVAILNAAYVDGIIPTKEYYELHEAAMKNFEELKKSISDYVAQLNAIDSSGSLAASAISDLADQILGPFMKANKKVGKEVKSIFDSWDTALQTEVLIGMAAGSLTPVDILQMQMLFKDMDGKTIEQKYKAIQDIPSSSESLKTWLTLKVAMEDAAEKRIAANKIKTAWSTGQTVFSIEMAYITAAADAADGKVKRLQAKLDKLNRVKLDSPVPEGTITEDDDDSSKKKDPYEFLKGPLQQLKQFRKESINASGGLKTFLKVLKKDMTGFKGMDQMLRSAGATQGFIDIVNGLDTEQLKVMGDRLYRIKNGKIIFGDIGNAIQKFTKEVELGKFNDQLQQSVIVANNQYKAYVKLRAAGLTASQALELTADNALAAAIAAEKVDSVDFKNFVKGAKEGSKATSELAKELKNARFQAEQEAETASDKMDDFFAYEEARIRLERYRQFTQQQGMSPQEFENTRIKPLEKEIETAEELVQTIQKQIDAEQEKIEEFSRGTELIGREEEKINEEYQKRNDALDEQINALDKVEKINQRMLDQQKRSLTLADALSQGDISAAAQIAQEMRQASAQASTDERKLAIEEQKTRLEKQRLAAIASIQVQINGQLYTRDQLEKLILETEDKIYVIQNTTLKDAEKIVENKQQELKDLNSILKIYEDSLSLALASIKNDSGLTKDEWTLIKDAVNTTNDYFDTMIVDLDEIAEGSLSIEKAWIAIEKAIRAAIAALGAFKGAQGGGGSGGTGGGSSIPSVGQPSNAEVIEKSSLVQTHPEYFLDKKDESGKVIQEGVFTRVEKGISTPSENIDYASAVNEVRGTPGALVAMSSGGVVPKYFLNGGFARGTDTVPAMLTPGEFVMSRYAVSNYGLDKMKAINAGSYKGDSMNNYNLTVNVKSDANPDEIARTVMSQIKQIDSMRLRGNRF
jgi:TP901 family phage tail tape measure protein